MKIYIAGKVSGLDYQEAVANFAKTEKQLIDAGIAPENIVNPTRRVPEGTPWKEAMDICIELLQGCTAIFIQRGWQSSIGTKHEIKNAQQLRLDMYWEEMHDMATIGNLIQTGI